MPSPIPAPAWKSLKLFLLLLIAASGTLSAQQAAVMDDSSLPDAPSSSLYQAAPQGTASISGSVVDTSGAAIADARITLAAQNGANEKIAMSNGKGEFTFSEIPAGTFIVTVSAKGFETFVSNEIHLSAGSKHELPLVELPVAPTGTSVEVRVTQDELAHEQLKAAEKQRVFGVLPNFYTSYIWNPEPLRPRHKFELALKSTTDPVAFATTAITAGVEQAHNTFPGYGSGPESFAKRYGAAYADRTISRFLGSAILPSLFHQDPRYFYRGSGTIRSRAFYAIAMAVVARGDNGNWQPNYSHVLGNFGAAGISNLYRAEEDRTASLTIRNGFIITAGNAVQNLVREFLSRKVTSNVPAYEQGKPAE